MRLSKKFAAIAISSTVALTATAAFAFWSSSGSGTGSAGTGTTGTVTVNQIGAPAGLYPGSTAQSLSGDFTNTGSPAYVASVTASVTATDKLGCAAADFVIGGSAPVNAQIVTGSPWSGLTVSMTNTAVPQDACKNASLTIAYTANAS